MNKNASNLSSSKQIKLGIFLQYLQMGLAAVIALIYTPIVLRALGKVEYGIYNVANSTIAYLSLLSLGFGTSYIRFYSLYKKDNNHEGIKNLNGLYLLVFTLIGVISLALGLFLSSNAKWFFNSTYSTNDLEIAKKLMIILTINLAISFPASVFSSYVMSQERFVFQKILNMGKTIISPTTNIVLLYFGFGSIGLVLTTTAISLIIDLINILYCFGKLKMSISVKKLEFRLLRDIFVFSIFIAANQLVEQINFQADNIILSKIVNGTAVAIYAVGSNLKTQYTNIGVAVSSVYAPRINLIVSKRECDMDEQLNALFIKVGRIQWFIIMLIMTGFIFFGRFFVQKWAGDGYDNSYYVALLLMCPMTFVLIQMVAGEVQRAKNLHKFRTVIYLFMAFINILISIWLASLWGEIGAALGTTISLVVCNIVFINIWYHKKVGLNVIKFWKSILSTIPGFIVPVLLGVMLMLFYKFNSLIDFSLLILLYSMTYCVSIFFLGFNNNERDAIKEMFRKVFKRHKNVKNAEER